MTDKISYIKTLGKSLKEISREHNLNYYTVCSRLQRGFTLEQSLLPKGTELFKLKGGSTRIKHFVVYKNQSLGLYVALKQACDDIGINYSKGYASNILTRYVNNRDGGLQNSFDRFLNNIKKKWSIKNA